MAEPGHIEGTEAGAPPGVVRLRCGVQHYAWGTTDFIPSLLGAENADGAPWAELWMGAHPDLPSEAELPDGDVRLDELIARAPERMLGADVARAHDGRLPYLFKVLSAAAPLSIQVHPSKSKAEAGFAREDAAGVPIDARERNYRDENHKPELLAALTDFYGLRGFRPLDEIARLLEETPELRPLASEFEPTPAGLASLYGRFMSASQGEVDALLGPLVKRLRDEAEPGRFSREDAEHWVLVSDDEYSKQGHHDRGLLSVYLLNLVRLRPGEAMQQPAGILHAYLEGSGVEIMANSNNVLRGGLTPKHVDVPELLDNVVFEGGEPEVVRPRDAGACESVFVTPAEEFELRRIELRSGASWRSGPEHAFDVLIVVEGEAVAESSNGAIELRKGDVIGARHGAEYTIRAPGATIYRATTPRGA